VLVIDTQVRERRSWTTPLIAVVALLTVLGATVALTLGRPDPAPADLGAPSAMSATPLPLQPLPTSAPAPSSPNVQLPAPATASRSARSTPRATGGNAAGGGSTAGGVAGSGRIIAGRTYTGRATFYGATGEGNCLFDASPDLMVVAMNQADYGGSQACGAWLAVTGPDGKTITVQVVDRCPECPVGALDLSQQAFTKLAPAVAGQITVTWRLLSPALSGPVAYVYKTGSSQYWCGIQVRNHRNPVRSLAVKVGGSWKALTRQEYNYFESPTGAGCGGAIQTTDIYGHTLTDTGIAIRPGAVQNGHGQFPPSG
jgi:expansin